MPCHRVIKYSSFEARAAQHHHKRGVGTDRQYECILPKPKRGEREKTNKPHAEK